MPLVWSRSYYSDQDGIGWLGEGWSKRSLYQGRVCRPATHAVSKPQRQPENPKTI